MVAKEKPCEVTSKGKGKGKGERDRAPADKDKTCFNHGKPGHNSGSTQTAESSQTAGQQPQQQQQLYVQRWLRELGAQCGGFSHMTSAHRTVCMMIVL